MARPVYDEQFLPRLVSVFFATFHPTEGPKVVYQVPEGTIAQSNLDDSDAASNPFSSSDDESLGEGDRQGSIFRRRSSDMTPGPREDVEQGNSAEDSLSELPSIRPSASSYSINDSAISDRSFAPGQSDITVVRQGQSTFTIRGDLRSGRPAVSTLDSLILSDPDSVSPHGNTRKPRHDSKSTNQSLEAENRTRTRRHHRSRQTPRSQDALFDFSPLADYLIPKAPLCNRLITCTTQGKAVSVVHNSAPAPSVAPKSRTQSFNDPVSPFPHSNQFERSIPDALVNPEDFGDHTDAETKVKPSSSFKILSYPVLLHNSARYARNTFIFNLGFVFDGRADVRAYEPVVRKCARVVRGLEESTSFVSNPDSQTRMYDIIEQLFEDLNSYSESFVALPDAPHSSYLRSVTDALQERRLFSTLSNASSNSLSASVLGIGGPQLAALAKLHADDADAESEATGSPSRSRGQSLGSIAASRRSSSALNYLLAQPPMPLSRSASNDVSTMISAEKSSFTDPQADTAKGVETAKQTVPTRPHILRSANSTHVSGTTVSTSTGVTHGDLTNIPTGQGTAGTRSQDESQTPIPHSQSTLLTAGSGAGSATRDRTSNSSSGSASRAAVAAALSSLSNVNGSLPYALATSTNALNHADLITDRIVSLRTINAPPRHLEDTTTLAGNAADAPTMRRQAGMGLPGRREPPHGLGRTVRDAINLKLFPTYASPPPINDWDVPVTLLRLDKMVDANWDLTMARVCPFIDGINHVKKIAQLADADLELTRQCMEHLIYYGCIVITDLFQFSNMYTLRPPISRLAEDEIVQAECASYVTRPGHPLPSYPTLLRLYSLLRPGLTLNDWIESNEMEVNVEAIGIDVRRFVSFGVIKGFLRRVHRYPVLLRDHEHSTGEGGVNVRPTERSTKRGEMSRAGSHSGGSPPGTKRRQESDSRERKWERSIDAPAMSGIDPRTIDREKRDSVNSYNKVKSRRRESEDKSDHDRTLPHSRWASSDTMLTREDGEQPDISPSKRRLAGTVPARRTSRATLRHSTATAFDLASIALNLRVDARQAARGIDSTERPSASPAKRASFSTLPSRGGTAGGGASRASQHTSATAYSSSTWYTPNTPGAGSLPADSYIFSGSTPSIPIHLRSLLDGTHCDDEMCTRFGVSWPELQRMLIYIGTVLETREYDSDDEDATPHGMTDFGERHSSRNHSFGGTRGASFGRAAYGSSDYSRPLGSGTHRGGASGWTSAAGMSGIEHADEGGRHESQGAFGTSVWAHLEPGSLERGDLGRVKVILL